MRDGQLDIHQTDNVESFGKLAGDALHLLNRPGRERARRRDGRGISRMAARRFHMFEDRSDDRGRAVRNAVDVQLDRVLKELVDQNRSALGCRDRFADIPVELPFRSHDRHAASAQDKTRTHQHRIADFRRDPMCIADRTGNAARRLPDPDLINQTLEEITVLGEIDIVRRRADNPRSGRLETLREIERGLSAVLHDHPFTPLAVVDLHHVLERKRLEVQPVGRIVIGRNGLGIGIHHHDFVPARSKRECRMTAAPVELDALPDAVGPAAEHHDPFRRIG